MISTSAPVAQLDRAFACGAKGRRFESCRVYHLKLFEKDSSFLEESFVMWFLINDLIDVSR